jgi:hypothetical protein
MPLRRTPPGDAAFGGRSKSKPGSGSCRGPRRFQGAVGGGHHGGGVLTIQTVINPANLALLNARAERMNRSVGREAGALLAWALEHAPEMVELP